MNVVCDLIYKNTKGVSHKIVVMKSAFCCEIMLCGFLYMEEFPPKCWCLSTK